MQRFAQAGIAAAGAVDIAEAEVGSAEADGAALGDRFACSRDDWRVIDRYNIDLDLYRCCRSQAAVKGFDAEGIQLAIGIGIGFPTQLAAAGQQRCAGHHGNPAGAIPGLQGPGSDGFNLETQ